MELNNDMYTLKIELVTQTPMLHFQYDQNGAVLRASEVKPRLDKYLEKIIAKSKYLGEQESSWKISGSNAFDYKMRIYADGKEDTVIRIKDLSKIKEKDLTEDDKRKSGICKLCWGDIEAVICRSCILKIICFHPELMLLIKENIDDFFITYNFGGKQSKGFGSFIPNENKYCCADKILDDDQIKTIGKVLTDNLDAKNYYYVRVEDFYDAFQFIHNFYKTIKGYKIHKESNENQFTMNLGTYVHENLKNTKYLNERKVIKNLVKNKNVLDYKNTKFYYIGIFLGMSNYIECTNDNKRSKARFQYDITNDVIQRFQSPIYFKYINGTVFIIARNTIEELLEKTHKFNFTYKGYILEKGQDYDGFVEKPEDPKIVNFELDIPTEFKFDINSFMDEFINTYNLIKDTKKNKNDITENSKQENKNDNDNEDEKIETEVKNYHVEKGNKNE